MNDLWGISGPDFLELYGALLVLPALIGVCLHWRTMRRNPVDASDVGVHHLAYLCGQARRATESAVAALVEAERVRVSSKGVLSGSAQRTRPIRWSGPRSTGVRGSGCRTSCRSWPTPPASWPTTSPLAGSSSR